jgi:hypothetical protein
MEAKEASPGLLLLIYINIETLPSPVAEYLSRIICKTASFGLYQPRCTREDFENPSK